MEGYKNIDNISLASMEQETVINVLHKKFEHQKELYQPKPESFFDEAGFDKEEIKKEIALTKYLKEKWENNNSREQIENKKISDVFGGIIVDQFCGDWMSNKAEAFFTAEPDDLMRKIDCVIEFKPEDEDKHSEYLALGIDVTFSSDYSTVKNKLDDIWLNDISHKKQVRVKYVDTEHFKGSLNVCRTVLAADKETVYELAKLYKNKNKEDINNHPFLANAILQLKYQLEAYYTYAQKTGAPGSYLRAITKSLTSFYRVYSDKEEFIAKHADNVIASEIFKSIQSYCDARLATIEKV